MNEEMAIHNVLYGVLRPGSSLQYKSWSLHHALREQPFSDIFPAYLFFLSRCIVSDLVANEHLGNENRSGRQRTTGSEVLFVSSLTVPVSHSLPGGVVNKSNRKQPQMLHTALSTKPHFVARYIVLFLPRALRNWG